VLKDASRLLLVWFAALTSAFIVLAILYFVAVFIFAWMLGGVTPNGFD